MPVPSTLRFNIISFVKKELNTKIELKDVQTGYQVANIFTKALAKSKLELLVDALGVSDCKHALMGSVKI